MEAASYHGSTGVLSIRALQPLWPQTEPSAELPQSVLPLALIWKHFLISLFSMPFFFLMARSKKCSSNKEIVAEFPH